MSLGDEQVFLPVIVEILQANAPARSDTRKHANSRLQAAVAERSVAIVMKDGVSLARQGCDDYVRLAVVIVVLEYHAHSGEWPAIEVERRSRLQRQFGECAVAIVVKQILLHAIVRNIDFRNSIAIEVSVPYTQALTFLAATSQP